MTGAGYSAVNLSPAIQVGCQSLLPAPGAARRRLHGRDGDHRFQEHEEPLDRGPLDSATSIAYPAAHPADLMLLRAARLGGDDNAPSATASSNRVTVATVARSFPVYRV
jgi:hypothetical protein